MVTAIRLWLISWKFGVDRLANLIMQAAGLSTPQHFCKKSSLLNICIAMAAVYYISHLNVFSAFIKLNCLPTHLQIDKSHRKVRRMSDKNQKNGAKHLKRKYIAIHNCCRLNRVGRSTSYYGQFATPAWDTQPLATFLYSNHLDFLILQ